MSGNARNERVDIPAIAEKIVSSRAPGPLPRRGDRVHRRPVAVADRRLPTSPQGMTLGCLHSPLRAVGIRPSLQFAASVCWRMTK
jgi:hypothetical protein